MKYKCSDPKKGKTCRGRSYNKKDWCDTCQWNAYHEERSGYTSYQTYPTREELEWDERAKER